MSLLLVIPCVSSELNSYKDSIVSSTSNFSKYKSQVSVYIIVQWEQNSNESEDFSELKKLGFNVIVSNVYWKSVSKARNEALKYAKNNKFDFVIFHDASVYYPVETCDYFFSCMCRKKSVKIKEAFSLNFHSRNNAVTYRNIKFNPIYHCYLWAWMFKVEDINCYFNESIGPGENTLYKSGEDVEFLFDNYYHLYGKRVREAKNRFVLHPPREIGFKKHLTYASGQGHLFKSLISRYPLNFRIWLDMLLFIGNSFFRVVLLKENSLLILKERLRGLFL